MQNWSQHQWCNLMSHQLTTMAVTIGPSGVRVLPLGVAAERSVHYFWDYFSFFLSSPPHTFLPEGVVLGLWNFARSFKSQKNKIWGKKKLRTPGWRFFRFFFKKKNDKWPEGVVLGFWNFAQSFKSQKNKIWRWKNLILLLKKLQSILIHTRLFT